MFCSDRQLNAVLQSSEAYIKGNRIKVKLGYLRLDATRLKTIAKLTQNDTRLSMYAAGFYLAMYIYTREIYF